MRMLSNHRKLLSRLTEHYENTELSASARNYGKKHSGKRKKELVNIPSVSVYELDIKELNRLYGENNWRIAYWDACWSSKISNIPRAVTCQSFEPCDNGDLIEYLSRSINQNRGIAESTSDVLQRQRAEKAADDAERLIINIDQMGETVGYMTNLIMPVTKDEVLLDRICRTVESIMAAIKCKIRLLGNLQKEAFKAISPYHTTIDEIGNIARRNVPLSTFAGGFPFASSSYSDRDGYYFCKDSQNGLVIIDPWKRGDDRTNSNFVIMGVPGTGKSATTKHIIISEYMLGTNVILILRPKKIYSITSKTIVEYCIIKNNATNRQHRSIVALF